jgi:hypothetical protein
MIKVLLSADPHDGNDAIERAVELPIVPRVGDMIACWDSESPFGATEAFLTVEAVVLSTFERERIVVAVRLDGYDSEQLERVVRGIGVMTP